MWRKCVVGLSAAAMLAVAAPGLAAEPDTSWDGLQRVRSKHLDERYLLPGADFRLYSKVMLDPLEVSFRRGWEKDANSRPGIRPRVSAEDAERIRSDLADGFREVFTKAYERAGYEVVTVPGPDVLRIKPMLTDVYLNAPDTSQPGRVYNYTFETGEATLAFEVRDAESNQLLGRSVDRGRTGRTAELRWATRVSNRAEFERLFADWARTLVDGMAGLKAASPIPPGGPQ